jgi:hypothetical protein
MYLLLKLNKLESQEKSQKELLGQVDETSESSILALQ